MPSSFHCLEHEGICDCHEPAKHEGQKKPHSSLYTDGGKETGLQYSIGRGLVFANPFNSKLLQRPVLHRNLRKVWVRGNARANRRATQVRCAKPRRGQATSMPSDTRVQGRAEKSKPRRDKDEKDQVWAENPARAANTPPCREMPPLWRPKAKTTQTDVPNTQGPLNL